MNVTRFALISLLAACTPAPQSSEKAPGIQQEVVLSRADSASARTRGDIIATAVAQGLVKRLQAQLEQHGAVGAVDFCSQTALALSDSLMSAYPGASVKRTSLRIRNLQNQPDAHERIALVWFDSVRTATGQLPASFVQAVGIDQVRFYRPLMVQPFCTQCHGKREEMDAGVLQILGDRYPADSATGYQAGDFRGVIRVAMPRARP